MHSLEELPLLLPTLQSAGCKCTAGWSGHQFSCFLAHALPRTRKGETGTGSGGGSVSLLPKKLFGSPFRSVGICSRGKLTHGGSIERMYEGGDV